MEVKTRISNFKLVQLMSKKKVKFNYIQQQSNI